MTMITFRTPRPAAGSLPVLALAWAVLSGVVDGAGPGPGPYLGSFTLRERPRPLPKAGSARALPTPEARMQALARLTPGFQGAALIPFGWRVVSEQLGFAVLEGDPATAPLLEALDGSVPGLFAFRPTRVATGTLAEARRLSRVDPVLQWGPAPNPGGVSGKGVLIGIIDYGFDTRHPAFLDSTGGVRFLAIWDPNLPTVPGAPFNHGQLKRKAELAADPAFGEREMDLHGTHVASVAAGSDRSGPYHGVAPEASLLGVNLSNRNDSVSSETQVMQGIQWIFRVADSLNMPCVVNLSLGNMHLGPHDGTSLFDRFIDTVTGPGRIVVGASGNDGAKRLHARIPLATGDTAGTWCRAPSLVDIWGEPGRAFRYQVLLMDSVSGAYMTHAGFLSTSTGRGRWLSDSLEWAEPGTGRKVPLLILARPENAAQENGKPRVVLRVLAGSQDPALAPKGLLMGVRLLGTGALHAWNAYADSFETRGHQGFTGGDNAYTLSEIGGTAKSMISVGAWVTTRAYTDFEGKLQDGIVDQAVGEAATWSSRGPAVDGRVKPDISAPGRMVVAALSKAVTSTPDWQTPRIVVWPDPSTLQGRYLAAEGTSQAAPFVSGVVALLLEVKPDLTPAQIRSILAETAQKDAYTGPLTPPDGTWGYGKVDAAAAVRLLRDVPARFLALRAPGRAPRAHLIGGMLRVEGLGDDLVDASLLDLQGRLVTRLDRRGDGGGYALRSGLPGPGVYVAVLRSPVGLHRFRVFRE